MDLKVILLLFDTSKKFVNMVNTQQKFEWSYYFHR